MSRALVSVLLGVMSIAAGGQSTPTLDVRLDEFLMPSRMLPCGIRAAVAQLKRATGLPLGFESTPECWGTVTRFERATSDLLAGLTAREVLDRVVAGTPSYRWREMNGVAVIRPVTAWDDPSSVLALPTEPFTATDAPPEWVLRLALRTSHPELGRRDHVGQTVADGPGHRPMSVTFAGGTLLDALNASVAAARGLGWQVMYGGRSPHERVPQPVDGRAVGVGFTTFAAADVTTFVNAGESSFYAGGLSFWFTLHP